MRTNLTLSIGLAAALGCTVAAAQVSEKAKVTGAESPLRFLLPQRAPFVGKIESLAKEGTVQASPDNTPLPLPEFRIGLVAGHYVALVRNSRYSLDGARLFRAVVTDVGNKGPVQFKIARKVADQLKTGELVMLFRPQGMAISEIELLPDLASVESDSPSAAKKESDHQTQLRSLNNLKQIGLALHNFHGVYGSFPPAVVIGPDKKPWHSWRVFLLPFVEAAPLYDEYKWDEPWDGPRNKTLLKRMPAVYSDPIYGENKDFYTHYAAITGDGMAFSAEGTRFDGKFDSKLLKAGRRIRDFSDGTYNSLLVGPVSPDRKIPWMKPDDVKIDDKFPELGKPGSFALAYKTQQEKVGPFLFCDGRTTFLGAEIGKEKFRKLLTINAGETLDPVNFTSASSPPPPLTRSSPVIYIIRKGTKSTARMVMEPLQQLPAPSPRVKKP